ncbi:MAG: ATP phosphoribosyltransferase regulatory subunit [Rickettsiales bacterium]|nr:ATP phosphoribosyltransferase regulatory subunit [Rickettsiales bacterium]
MNKTLLPSGCYDVLPPFARQETELSFALLSVFEAYGYEQVSPPLLEYTESLLAGRGSELSAQTFRVMDPEANKVMGFRPDMTLQIARIAATRMAGAPKPLRLCYNGLILRLQGEQFQPSRQLRQAGIELIGTASPEADAEVILVAATALQRAGIRSLSIDLNLPGIVSALLATEKMDNAQAEKLFQAVAHKDVSALKTMPIAYRDTLVGLMQAAGPAAQALPAIERLDLPDTARKQVRDLADVVHILNACGSPDWTLTVDATENRGLSYHSGINFSIFIPGAAFEVGRGGRYLIEGGPGNDIEATGFTLYVETLRSLLPVPARPKRVFIADKLDAAQAATLQAQGFQTVHALSEYGYGEDEARRLSCSHYFKNGALTALN